MDAPLALYRRYRPETFAEVVGQEHVTDPLCQALRNNRVNHAYLFSGPRGCGKTTSARILARCLNCAEGPTPQPCGQCQSCTDLGRGGPGSIDVIEIDAASHGGVDDARDLRERAFFAPVSSRYKIYVVDEAHMVTPQGFNALLKLVEEPPEHLKFVFATTEPDKVIGTIRSRTHHYPFRLAPPKLLQDYLGQLCEREGVPIEPAALPLVVRSGGGSFRDSLSVLDQLIGGAGADGVTYQRAAALLGHTPEGLLDSVVDAFAAHDGAEVFGTIDKVIESGQDPKRFGEDLLRRLRDLIVVANVPDAGVHGLLDGGAEQAERLTAQAARFGRAELSRAADVVSAGLTEMRGATAPRLQLELICARVLLPGADDTEQGVHARIDRLERRVSIAGAGSGDADAVRPSVDATAAAQPAAPSAAAAAAATPPAPTPTSAPDAPAAGSTPPTASAAPAARAGGVPAEAAAAYAPQDDEQAAASAPTGDTAAAWPDPTAAGAATQPPAPGAPAPEVDAVSGAPDEPDAAGPATPGASGPAQDDVPARPSGSAGVAEPVASTGHGGSSDTDPAHPGQPGQQSPAAAAAPAPTAGGAAGNTGNTANTTNTASGGSGGSGGGGGIGLHEMRQLWPNLLERVKTKRRFTWIMLSQNAQVADVAPDTLVIALVNQGARDSFVRSGSDEILRQALQEEIGVDWRIEAIVDGGSRPDSRASGASNPPRQPAPASPSGSPTAGTPPQAPTSPGPAGPWEAPSPGPEGHTAPPETSASPQSGPSDQSASDQSASDQSRLAGQSAPGQAVPSAAVNEPASAASAAAPGVPASEPSGSMQGATRAGAGAGTPGGAAPVQWPTATTPGGGGQSATAPDPSAASPTGTAPSVPGSAPAAAPGNRVAPGDPAAPTAGEPNTAANTAAPASAAATSADRTPAATAQAPPAEPGEPDDLDGIDPDGDARYEESPLTQADLLARELGAQIIEDQDHR